MFIEHGTRMLSDGFFFFNDTATTEIYTLSLHDALPIFTGTKNLSVATLLTCSECQKPCSLSAEPHGLDAVRFLFLDRKSTRLNSSHANISYAVFCLKKKKTIYLFAGLLRNSHSIPTSTQ